MKNEIINILQLSSISARIIGERTRVVVEEDFDCIADQIIAIYTKENRKCPECEGHGGHWPSYKQS
jgi:hypothetical protein